MTKDINTETGYMSQSCHIYIFGPTKPDSSSFQYVLAMDETYTRYSIFVPLLRGMWLFLGFQMKSEQTWVSNSHLQCLRN